MNLNKQLLLKKGNTDKLNNNIIKYIKNISNKLQINLLTYNSYLNKIKKSKKSIITNNTQYQKLITNNLGTNKKIMLQFIRYRNYLNYLSKWPEFTRIGKLGDNQNIYDY